MALMVGVLPQALLSSLDLFFPLCFLGPGGQWPNSSCSPLRGSCAGVSLMISSPTFPDDPSKILAHSPVRIPPTPHLSMAYLSMYIYGF